MSTSTRSLRAGLIRLAHDHPEFRGDLLPLLKSAAVDKDSVADDLLKALDLQKKVSAALKEIEKNLGPENPISAVERATGESEALEGRLEQLAKSLKKDGI